MRFDANFAGSKGSVGVNPASTAVYTIYKNGVQCGTISISTSGVFTFASSSGNAVALNAQDRLTVIAPNPQDGALSDVGFTLVAQRSSVFPPGEALPIYVFRDTYDNAATYQPYELVTYEGSTYMARSATTGNAPSTGGVVDSHWAAIALAGAAGGVQVSQDIGGTAASPIVVGLQGKGLDSGVGSPSDGDILVYDGELGKWKAGAAGLTGFDFGMQPCGFASGSSLNASNFAGLLLVVPYATAIKSVKFVAASAAATAKIYPAIYEFSNGALGALLATGPQVTGVTAGLNSIPLTSALSVSAGQLIAVGLVVSVANISLANCPGYGSCWFSCSGAPPNPASTTSFGTSGWASMWAGVI
jgi:hypothetical protein